MENWPFRAHIERMVITALKFAGAAALVLAIIAQNWPGRRYVVAGALALSGYAMAAVILHYVAP